MDHSFLHQAALLGRIGPQEGLVAQEAEAGPLPIQIKPMIQVVALELKEDQGGLAPLDRRFRLQGRTVHSEEPTYSGLQQAKAEQQGQMRYRDSRTNIQDQAGKAAISAEAAEAAEDTTIQAPAIICSAEAAEAAAMEMRYKTKTPAMVQEAAEITDIKVPHQPRRGTRGAKESSFSFV